MPLIAGGLVLLIVGGEFIVRGAVTLADRLSLSPLFVGLVVVAFGTSAPEMAVSIGAVLQGETDIAVGNVVGSNISNVMLILGLGALIYPIPAQRNVVFRDALTLLLAVSLLTWLGQLGGYVERQMGICMLTLLGAYLAFSYFSERVRLSPAGEVALGMAEKKRVHIPGLLFDLVLVTIGVVGVAFGAHLLVDGAVGLARDFGVSEAVIGLSVVAVGTSLPELTTVVISALKKQPELAVGNVIGSNIFNIFAVLGTTATILPVGISPGIAHFDLPIMFLSTLILIPFLMTNWRLSRIEGLLLLVGYGVYLWLLFGREGGQAIEIF